MVTYVTLKTASALTNEAHTPPQHKQTVEDSIFYQLRGLFPGTHVIQTWKEL